MLLEYGVCLFRAGNEQGFLVFRVYHNTYVNMAFGFLGGRLSFFFFSFLIYFMLDTGGLFYWRLHSGGISEGLRIIYPRLHIREMWGDELWLVGDVISVLLIMWYHSGTKNAIVGNNLPCSFYMQ